MADFYVWDPKELGLDVSEMDLEHQTLIKKMNKLYDINSSNKSYEEIWSAIEDLSNFVVKHFTQEEAYMQKIGFPGLETHKIIHKQLLTQFTGHAENFKSKRKMSEDFFLFLKVWLTSHIKGIDHKYADFSHKKKAA